MYRGPLGQPDMVRPPPHDMARPPLPARHGAAAFGRHCPTWCGRVRSPPPDMARPRSAATARHGSAATARHDASATARHSEMNHYFIICNHYLILYYFVIRSFGPGIYRSLSPLMRTAPIYYYYLFIYLL